MPLASLDVDGGEVGRRRPAGNFVGFTAFAAAGILTLAAAVLLPEYAALAGLRARRDVLAHHVRCEEKLAAYNDRMIHAVQNDPVLVARLMIRHGNYRPAGCQTVEIESALPNRSVPERLLAEARNPPPSEDRLPVRAGLWMSDPVTSETLALLGLAMLAAGVALFGRRRRPAESENMAPIRTRETKH